MQKLESLIWNGAISARNKRKIKNRSIGTVEGGVWEKREDTFQKESGS